MCGICGIYNFNGRDVVESLLTAMSNTIAHRGPDDSGSYVSKNRKLGFGFRRLSIIDLSPAGHQPMCNEDGSVWIVFNGEIYNHIKIRRELEALGHNYRSHSDTETLIHAYEEFGEQFVHKLEGMFAMAIWDERKEKLLLYRDRIGIKPLYYTVAQNQLVFGSEIKAILEHPSVKRGLSEVAFYHYLTFINTPAPYTMFKDIFKLEPGHYLVVGKHGNITNNEYWDAIVPKSGEDYNNEEYCKRRIRELLTEAIEKRMMSDVPFGVFLSGGIDSSTNVALMSQLMNRPVDTFSVAIEGQEEFNEFQYARQIRDLFKTNHHEVVINSDTFLEFFPKMVYHQDEPLADPVCVPLYYVSKLARDNGTIVVQVGEGSDEQFCGYTSYARVLKLYYRFGLLGRMPGVVTRNMYRSIVPLLAAQKKDYRQNIIKNLLYKDELFWGNAIAFYEAEKHKLLSDQLLSRLDGQNSRDVVEGYFSKIGKAKHVDYAEKLIYLEFKNRLPELLLMRVDKMTMATSVEARVPFLDHKLVEFSMNIPWELKIRNGETKYILKKAVEGLIPDSIIYRKKIGFTGSSRNMLTGKIYQYAKNMLLTGSDSYFNREYLSQLLEEYEHKGINYSLQIWCLLNFKLWYKYWIEGETI
jgi:asparagine synthase (glutamine-hydrolysing)